MAVETADDRLLMLADFGVPATYSDTTITGIFDNDYEAVDVGCSVPFAQLRPRFFCRSADVSGIGEGSTLTIDDTRYTVSVVMSDGTGMTELMLESP